MDTDNWNFQLISCAAFSTPTLKTGTKKYKPYGGVGAADLLLVDDFDTLFGNADVANCPITSCTMEDNDCLGTDMATEYPNYIDYATLAQDALNNNDWTYTMLQDVADGYRYVICIRCTNGVSEGTMNNVHLCQCEDID